MYVNFHISLAFIPMVSEILAMVRTFLSMQNMSFLKNVSIYFGNGPIEVGWPSWPLEWPCWPLEYMNGDTWSKALVRLG